MILNNARLIDGTGRVWERAAVRIEGDRIAAVTAGDMPSANEETLDLGGRTVMPGLINCHTHLCLDGSPDPVSAWSCRSITENVLIAGRHAEMALKAVETLLLPFGSFVLKALKTLYSSSVVLGNFIPRVCSQFLFRWYSCR